MEPSQSLANSSTVSNGRTSHNVLRRLLTARGSSRTPLPHPLFITIHSFAGPPNAPPLFDRDLSIDSWLSYDPHFVHALHAFFAPFLHLSCPSEVDFLMHPLMYCLGPSASPLSLRRNSCNQFGAHIHFQRLFFDAHMLFMTFV